MGRVNTEKKLELIKSIRMQNQYNRQLFRSREGFLYGDDPAVKKGELYALEAEEKTETPDRGKVYGSFRIRFVVAAILLGAYILCDVNQISYLGEDTASLLGRITSNSSFTDLFELIK